MQSTIKSILNSVVVIFVVVWLALNIFGLMPYLSRVRWGNYHSYPLRRCCARGRVDALADCIPLGPAAEYLRE